MTHIMAQRGAVLICLAATMGLAGCAGDSGGDQLSTISPSVPAQSTDTPPKETGPSTPTPVETETPIAPVMPPAMANGDEAGARAAADYVLELYTYTYWSGDTGPLKAFCDPDSTFCASIYENIAQRTANGERYVGGELSWAEDPQATDQNIEYPAFELRGKTQETANAFIDSQGKTLEEHPANSGVTTMIVYFLDDTWHLFDLIPKTNQDAVS